MRARAAVLLLSPLISACVPGRIYTHVWAPLDANFDRTPVLTAAAETGHADVKHVSVPLLQVNFDLDFMWSSNAFGDIARREGLDELYYADLETFSVLGIFNDYTVHLYGRPAAEPPAGK